MTWRLFFWSEDHFPLWHPKDAIQGIHTNRKRIRYDGSPEGYRRPGRDHWLGMGWQLRTSWSTYRTRSQYDGSPEGRRRPGRYHWLRGKFSVGPFDPHLNSFCHQNWRQSLHSLTNATNPLDSFLPMNYRSTTWKRTSSCNQSTRPLSPPITGGKTGTPEVAHEDRSLFSTQRWRLWPFGSNHLSSLPFGHVFVDPSLCWPQLDSGYDALFQW